MSANFRNPNFLLPNELNRKLPASGAETGSGLTEDRHSLYSMEFDGGTSANKIVATGEKFNFVQQTGIFSVSCWIKLDNYTSATLQSICHTDNGGRLQDGFWLFYDNRSVTGSAKRLGFYLYGGNSDASDLDLVAKENAFSDNDWHHVAVIGSSAGTYGTLTLYIDGSSVATRALLSGSLTTDTAYNDFTIGDYNSNNAFDGKIDEVAIWSSDQTSNISNIYNGGSPGNIMALPNKPYAYYPLGEQARDNTEWQFPNEVLQSQVFDFDGSTDFIEIPKSNALDFVNTNFSISIWLNPDISHNGLVLTNYYGSNGWGVYYQSGSIRFYDAPVWTTVTTISTGQWSHILIVGDYTGNNLLCYKNGVEVYNSSHTFSITDPDIPVFIGSERGTGFFFNGKLSNIALWESNQSANITNIYNNGSPQSSYTVTPTAWYKLNATNTYAGLNPNYHNALSFDGSDQIDFGNDSSFNFTGGMTVSGWVKGSAGSGTKKIILKDDLSSQRSWQMNIRSSSSNLPTANVRGGSDVPTVTGTKTLLDDNWHHFALVFTPSTSLSFFIDGEPAGTQTSGVPASIDTSTANVIIGFNQFAGEASNFAIFNQSISAEDVKYLYNGGTPQTNISFEPVSWWKLDNLTTGIQDSGSASNNGTNSGATAVSSSVAVNQWNFNNVSQSQTPNYSSVLSFDDTNDYIDCGNDSSLQISQNISVSCWFKCTTDGVIISKGQYAGEAASAGWNYFLKIGAPTATTTTINWSWYTTSSEGSSTGNRIYYLAVAPKDDVTDGNWHNIVATRSSTGSSLWLDGVYIANNGGNVSGDLDYMVNSSQNVTIGTASDLTNYFGGELSNIQIWNTVLTEADALSIYNNGQPNTTAFGSPISWWKLNNTASGIQDSGSASNDGTNNGATEIQTNVWTPRLNGESDTLPSTALVSSDLQFESPYSNFSLDFDGSTNYLNTNQSLNSSYTALTLSAWVNYTSISDYTGTIFGQWIQNNTGGSTIIVYTVSNKIQVYYNNSGGLGSLTSTSTLSTGAWYNVVLKFDGSTLKLYINGNEEASGALTAINNSAQNLILGAYSNSGQTGYQAHLNGKLDECAIFNKALTQSEISQVYNNGYAANLTSLSPTSWWRLGEDAYFVGNDITIPNQIANAPNGTGAGTQTSILVANAPGSYASGVGTNLADTDRKGEAPESSANSQSINMIPGDVHPYIPGYVPAKVDNIASMSFDGVNDYFIGPTIGFGTNDFSISLWVNYSYGAGNARFNTLIDFRETAYNVNGLSFFLLENKASVYIGGVGTIGTSTITLSQNLWTNIVLTKTSGEYKVYFNDTNSSRSEVLGTNTTSLDEKTANIGIEWDESFGPFNGLMDEFAIFDYALTPKQIKQDIYDASTTGKAADLNNNSNLTAPVAWYRMGD